MKNIKRGFKLTSPLKIVTGGGEDKSSSSNSSSTTTSTPAQSGGYKVTSTKTTVKKSDTGAAVKSVPKAERYKKARPKGWSDEKLAAHNKKKRAEWDAQDKKAEESKASSKSGSEETTTKNTPELTEEKAGTTSDTFTSEEKRVQNRGELVTNRFERKTGRQNLNRDERAIKNTAEYKNMTSAERKAVKNELRHGQTAEQKKSGKSSLDIFGADVKTNAEQARKMKYGQGEQNKSYVKQQLERPGEASTTRNAQYNQGANPLNRSNTKNYADVEKAVEGGKKVKVEPGSNLPESVEGTTKTASSVSKETNTTEIPPATTEKPTTATSSKYDYSKNVPFLAASNQGPLSDPNAVGRMKASALKFVMKGFGSKAGFNFNKKK